MQSNIFLTHKYLSLFIPVLTFPCLAHGSCVSATLTLVIHPKCPHFAILGQNARVSLAHSNLSYKVTLQICHLAFGFEEKRKIKLITSTFYRQFIKPD